MRNYFYKINKTYIDSFTRKVNGRYKNSSIHNDSKFMKALLREVNDLFKFLGGMVSSKDNIPKADEYPDAAKYNSLILDINTDLNKLFTSQTIVEQDVNNLLNFNSNQRIKTYENLTSTQQLVYSLYIKNKKSVGGETVIPAENPFTSSDNLSNETNGTTINQDRGSLTLAFDTTIVKPVDIKNVFVYFNKVVPAGATYPNNRSLHLGSHWKTSGKESHFISDNLSDVENYRQMMVDNPQNNYGVGWCEFEAVRTEISPRSRRFVFNALHKLLDANNGVFSTIYSTRFVTPDELAIKTYIGKKYNRDAESVYLDIPNSLQGKYITYNLEPLYFINPQYKIVIPFTNDAPPTNEIIVTFQPDSLGFFPKINWTESKVYTNDFGSDVAYPLLAPSEYNKVTDNGEYRCMLKDAFIKPTRLELIVEYGSDQVHWVPIDFMMSHYSYNVQKNYYLDQTDGQILLLLNKTYDVFVDAEADEENEKNRALNVLLGRRK